MLNVIWQRILMYQGSGTEKGITIQ
uniref:Uncharacterized protein n=1 Tax=Anguilla anguilla TaxID=7936 RepID=A0A0E9PKC9_ANGAN